MRISGPLLSKTWLRLSGTPPPELWRMAPPDPPPPPPPPERWLRPRMRFMFILFPFCLPIVGGPGGLPGAQKGIPGYSLGQPRSIGVDDGKRRIRYNRT